MQSLRLALNERGNESGSAFHAELKRLLLSRQDGLSGFTECE